MSRSELTNHLILRETLALLDGTIRANGTIWERLDGGLSISIELTPIGTVRARAGSLDHLGSAIIKPLLEDAVERAK